MVYFPERQAGGTWVARKIFTKRIPHTVDFQMDGPEFELYRDVTRFVRRESTKAAARGDDPRARAIGFSMSLYQRRLASSTYAMRHSLENRIRRLDEGLKRAQELVRLAPPDLPAALSDFAAQADLPDPDEFEEMEESERERLEEMLDAITLAGNAEQIREEIAELKELAAQAKAVEDSGSLPAPHSGARQAGEAKLSRLKDLLEREGFFRQPDKRLLIRDFYSGRLGEADLEDRLLKNVDEKQFRAICQNALEGLAAKKLNLEMLIERRARAQERRVVPETIARFIRESSDYVPLTLKAAPSLPHAFDGFRTPSVLRRFENQPDWRLPPLAARYPRFSTDRETAEKANLEWVTPGHPFFEALRRHALGRAQEAFSKGACFYSLQHSTPARLDFYRARVVDGLGNVIHERLQHALTPFLEDVRSERLSEVDRIAAHVELSLTELIQKADEEIGKAAADVEKKLQGAEGRLAQAEARHSELMERREKRRQDLERQRALSLQGVQRIASAIVLPHPEREAPDVRRLRPDAEVEEIAMRVVMQQEKNRGCQVYDVHEKNLGYDVTSLDLNSGELRLIEVKGIGGSTGTVLLTPNERRVAEDRRDCYWLYVVTSCKSKPGLQDPIKDPARFPWHEVKKVDHYYLSVDALTQPMQVQEKPEPYGKLTT